MEDGGRSKSRRRAAADLDGGFADQARDELVALVIFDKLVLSAFGVGALDGEDHST
jgi:hypothetical protein